MRRNTQRELLRGMAYALLVTVAFALFVGAWVLFIQVAKEYRPAGPQVGRHLCDMAEFHPDISPAQREACRAHRRF